jgi:hypothetical protein
MDRAKRSRRVYAYVYAKRRGRIKLRYTSFHVKHHINTDSVCVSDTYTDTSALKL